MPEIMTEEYCRQCPWFIEGIGFLPEDDPYWEAHPSKCLCKQCFKRDKCQENGSEQDIMVCMLACRGVILEEEAVRKGT